MILHHLTLNTGNLVCANRLNAPPKDVAPYQPIVMAKGGAVPDLDEWHIDIMHLLNADLLVSGGAYFQIANEPGLSKSPAVMAIACWEQATSAAFWDHASIAYGGLREPLQAVSLWREPPSAPPGNPWLAVWLTPWIAVADITVVRQLGQVEQRLAWALIDAGL